MFIPVAGQYKHHIKDNISILRQAISNIYILHNLSIQSNIKKKLKTFFSSHITFWLIRKIQNEKKQQNIYKIFYKVQIFSKKIKKIS